MNKLNLLLAALITLVGCGSSGKSTESFSDTQTANSDSPEPIEGCVEAVCAGNGYEAREFVRTKSKVIHFYGDSISIGYGFMKYDYPSFLNRIDETTSKLFEIEGMDVQMRRASSQDAGVIWSEITSDIIRSQDTIVFENAGPHFNHTESYRDWLNTTITLSLRKEGIKVRNESDFILTTMFDFNPTIPNSGYDTIIDNSRSINDVIGEVARDRGTGLIDWNTQIDALDAILRPQGVILVKDTIHPTVWGSIAMSISIAKNEGALISDLSPIADELMVQMNVMVQKGFNPRLTRDQVTNILNLMAQ